MIARIVVLLSTTILWSGPDSKFHLVRKSTWSPGSILPSMKSERLVVPVFGARQMVRFLDARSPIKCSSLGRGWGPRAPDSHSSSILALRSTKQAVFESHISNGFSFKRYDNKKFMLIFKNIYRPRLECSFQDTQRSSYPCHYPCERHISTLNN